MDLEKNFKKSKNLGILSELRDLFKMTIHSPRINLKILLKEA